MSYLGEIIMNGKYDEFIGSKNKQQCIITTMNYLKESYRLMNIVIE